VTTNNLTNPIPIFYSPEQSVDSGVVVSYTSPSAHKPRIVVERALELFGDKVALKAVTPVSRDDLSMVHDRTYVRDVLDCAHDNGFGNKSPEVAATLRWTSGSFYSAAKYALQHQTMAMSPTSGFHHACYDRGMGFCTFNGLMVAAAKMLDETQTASRIGIIDFDAHYGNGTDDIIQRLEFSKQELVHETFGKYAIKKADYKMWLRMLPEYLESKFQGCDILFYQAGADPHVDDPYGGFLTTEEMLERDNIVFAMAKRTGMPIVWNLAGGYQTPVDKVIQLHMNTFEAAFANQF